jgi:hypothetical protein
MYAEVMVVSIPVLFPFRTVGTATVQYTAAPHHRRRVTIDHRPLEGVTPAMLLDWFTHLDGAILYGGVVTARYLAWHPLDHSAGSWPVRPRAGVRAKAPGFT